MTALTRAQEEQEATQQKQVIVALVENKPGVLNRVVSLFRRRNFNVDSLTVGRTHKPDISRVTIVFDAKQLKAQLIIANLQKLINIIDVRHLSEAPHVSRDLALIKVRTDDPDSRNGLTQICEHFPARIIDIGPFVAILEISAAIYVIEQLIEELRPLGIVEMVRTGVVAMGRGIRIHDADLTPIRRSTHAVNGNA